MKPHAEIEMTADARTLLDAMVAYAKPAANGGRFICADTITLRQISGIPHRLITNVLGELRGRNLITRKAYSYWHISAR